MVIWIGILFWGAIAAFAASFVSMAIFIARVFLKQIRESRLLSSAEMFENEDYRPDLARVRVSMIAFIICLLLLAVSGPTVNLISKWNEVFFG